MEMIITQLIINSVLYYDSVDEILCSVMVSVDKPLTKFSSDALS